MLHLFYFACMNDKKKRCNWCLSDPLYVEYHDNEWGVPEYDDRKLFEMINLEGAQAGLSWITVLKKREGYLKAFDNFDAEKIVKYSDKKLEKMRTNPEIIRNRLKIAAVRSNARIYLDIRESGISFSDYIWKFVNGKPIVNKFKTMSDIPAKTEVSERMSKQMKKDGFKFVGPTIVYAFMQACGMVNDHVISCHRYKEC